MDFKNNDGYRKPVLSGDYSEVYLGDLADCLGNALPTINNLIRKDELTQESFVRAVGMAYAAMERVVNADKLNGFNFQETLKRYQDCYRWILEELDKIEYPSGVEKTVQLLEDALTLRAHD